MKLLVFSDSHGSIREMLRITELEKPDMAVHLGDSVSDARQLCEAFPDLDFRMVPGNAYSDLLCGAGPNELFIVENHRIFMTHGHHYRVKNGYDALFAAGEAHHADLILCGHTHVAVILESGFSRLMNPGSVAYGRDGMATYGVAEINRNRLVCTIHSARLGNGGG